MRRRDLIALAASAAAWPRLARAQSAGALPIIGILCLNSSEERSELMVAFQDGLADLGYRDGKTITIVGRYAGGNARQVGALAKEVAALHPRVIFADTATPIKAMREAAPGVPIVGAQMSNPIVQGLVASFAHPGGDVTGIASEVDDMGGKQVELALEAIPGARSMGLLRNPEGDNSRLIDQELRAAAAKRGLVVYAADARTPNEIQGAIWQLADSGAAFFYIQPNGLFNEQISQIARLARERRLPTISDQYRHVTAGTLMSYGVKTVDSYRRAAVFVDKILKGANPADLPVEFPTSVVLALNLKTAKALGITVPQSILLRADEVIE